MNSKCSTTGLSDRSEGAWIDVEGNVNACEKENHDQPWSPSRAVTSMACRCTTTVTDPAARMSSTMHEVFFPLPGVSLAPVPVLSSRPRSRSIHHAFGCTAPPTQPQYDPVDTPALGTRPASTSTNPKWRERKTEWIPAFAEITPRIGKKCSGGKDGAVGSRPPSATMPMEVMPCNWSW
jgi:hypothetical protein